MVQAEGANESEFPRIAGVFFNRLEDPSFKPRGMLQSDPTAGYGCLVARERIESCRGYSGRVRPAMLRDESNRYNTYRHAGLPPGPIGNPGAAALRAVLEPERTDFFYFYADGKGGRWRVKWIREAVCSNGSARVCASIALNPADFALILEARPAIDSKLTLS